MFRGYYQCTAVYIAGFLGMFVVLTPGATISCSDERPCLNYGTCKIDFESKYCVCYDGFYGDRCQYTSIPCSDEMPCLNYGTCKIGFESKYCVCYDGYFGDLCQYKIRPPSSTGGLGLKGKAAIGVFCRLAMFIFLCKSCFTRSRSEQNSTENVNQETVDGTGIEMNRRTHPPNTRPTPVQHKPNTRPIPTAVDIRI